MPSFPVMNVYPPGRRSTAILRLLGVFAITLGRPFTMTNRNEVLKALTDVRRMKTICAWSGCSAGTAYLSRLAAFPELATKSMSSAASTAALFLAGTGPPPLDGRRQYARRAPSDARAVNPHSATQE